MLALAFLVPLAAGAYDLSIGAVMSLSLALVDLAVAAHRLARAASRRAGRDGRVHASAASPGSSS